MAQKLSWIKRIVNSDDNAWCHILAAKYPKILNVITLGGEWVNSINKESTPSGKQCFNIGLIFAEIEKWLATKTY